jgi:hypothetical protein
MILYDDLVTWENLLPLTYTRSIAECRIGILTIQEKWAHYLNEEIQIAYAKDYLKLGELRNEELRVVSHILPNKTLVESIKNLGENSILTFEGEEIASNKVSTNSAKIAYQGEITFVKFPWHFFLENDAEIRKDYELLTAGRTSAHVSSDNKVIGESIFIEPGLKCIVAL